MTIIAAGHKKWQTPDRVPFNYYCGKTLQEALDGPHSFVKSRDASCSTSYWVLKTYIDALDDEVLTWLDGWALQMRNKGQLSRVMETRNDWSRR